MTIVKEEFLSVKVVEREAAEFCEPSIVTCNLILQRQVGNDAVVAIIHRHLQLVDGVTGCMRRGLGSPVTAFDIQQRVRNRFGHAQVINQLLSDLDHVQILAMSLPTGYFFEIFRVIHHDKGVGGRDVSHQQALLLVTEAVTGYGTGIHRTGRQRVGNADTAQHVAFSLYHVGKLPVRLVSGLETERFLLLIESVKVTFVGTIGSQEALVVSMNGGQVQLLGVGNDAVVTSALRHDVGGVCSRILHPTTSPGGIRKLFTFHNVLNDVE